VNAGMLRRVAIVGNAIALCSSGFSNLFEGYKLQTTPC